MVTNLGQVVLVKDIRPGIRGSTSFLNSFTLFNNKLYFSAFDGVNGSDLWVTDGTTAGTRLVKETNSDLGFSPRNLTVFNNKLYFEAEDGVNGRELWVSDGTSEGTQLLKDINSIDLDNTYISNFTEFKNKLYFRAEDGVNGRELWVTDGTSEGTQLVKDINPGTNAYGPKDSDPFSLTEFKNKLYFSATNANGNELWVSDGTKDGTRLLKNINPGAKSSGPFELTVLNNKLFFVASNEINGRELWVSDGTSTGTQLVKDINPGNPYSAYYSLAPRNLTVFNNKLYFNAEDGNNGRELWVSDGTTAGTQLLADISPGSGDSDPNGFTPFNDKLYFIANSGLWVSDGTSVGTQLVKDLSLSVSPSGSYYQFTEFNGKLYFAADNSSGNGRELWVSDGTSAGTQLVADINLGRNSFNPSQLTVVGDKLLFVANNGISGSELFKLTFDRSSNIIGSNNADNLNGTVNANIIEGLNGSDILSGKSGNDTLLGNNGNDILVGDAGNDSLAGGNGMDNLAGGDGNDILTGGDGNDTLDGGIGTNILSGGANNDLFILKSGSGSQSIIDFQIGSDKLGLAGGLEFDDLTFTNNRVRFGNDDLLATLVDASARNLTEADFVVV